MQAKLSKSIAYLKPRYQAIVVGSGYGASIAASRLARAGQQVCLLEKGREIRPGEFPDTISKAGPQLQLNSKNGCFGDDTGLYDVVVGDGINIVKGCGLGGTSLINANVSIMPEPRVFDQSAWPNEIRHNTQLLYENMQRAKDMLRPSPYPEGQPGYPLLPKTKAHQLSAKALNEPWTYADINVNFIDQTKGNHVGIAQPACHNCGDCCSGCNTGAKNTLLMNYLPDAVNFGAEIFCEVSVHHIQPLAKGWRVYYQILNTGRQKFEAPLLFVEADRVFLGAGATGSSEILMRSAQNGAMTFSEQLGKRFTGNGDVLGFAYNTDHTINGIGFGTKEKAPVGPCITSIIDARHKPQLADGMVIEEGSVPGAIRGILKPMLFLNSRTLGHNTETGWENWLEAKKREAETLFKGADHGALNNTQTYLIMTHDSATGQMHLNNKGHLELQWPNVGKEKIFEKANNNLLESTKAMGGVFVKNPVWTNAFDFDLVTVHPLGGCVMGSDASSGVTNHLGQVFHGQNGQNLYDGLFVTDGAIVPCSLGTNPLLTIAGLAERSMYLLAQQQGWALDYGFTLQKPKPSAAEPIGFTFTETMKGYISELQTDTYLSAYTHGQNTNMPFQFTLSVFAEDVDAFVADPDHLATMAGTVLAPTLSSKALTVSNAHFNLFVKDATNTDKKKMKYNFLMHSIEGKSYYFEGYKDVENNEGFDLWNDLTTLYIDIYRGKNNTTPLLAKGILKINPLDFATQLGTMRSTNAQGLAEKSKGLLAFSKLFGLDVWDTYVL
jgi:cholesterol oxidase